MNWLIIVAVAYFLFALASVTDKFLVSQRLRPTVYAFYVAVLSGVISLVLIPFGFHYLGWQLLLIDLVSGLFFIGALIFLYKALATKETSRIFPITGGLQSILILVLAYFLVGETLAPKSLLAFFVVVLGVFIIEIEKGKAKIGRPAIYYVVLSSLFFALSLTLEKYVYTNFNSFISGFVWNRFGNLLAAGLLLLHQPTRNEILKSFRTKDTLVGQVKTYKIFLFGQLCGGLGSFLQRYAINLGSVSLVSALQGLQYALLLVITLFLSLKFPRVLKEKITGKILIQKIIAIVLIGLGLAILAIK